MDARWVEFRRQLVFDGLPAVAHAVRSQLLARNRELRRAPLADEALAEMVEEVVGTFFPAAFDAVDGQREALARTGARFRAAAFLTGGALGEELSRVVRSVCD